MEPEIETFEYSPEDEEYIKANKEIVENLKAARALTGRTDHLRNDSQIHLLIRINQKKTLESY